jgi:hypothetical protein
VTLEDGIAEIVAEAEQALDHGGWPNHPLDDDQPDEPLPDRVATMYLGAAGTVWALHRLGSTIDLGAIVDDALARYREQPDYGDWVPGLLMGEAGILLVARIVGASCADDERLEECVVENERNPAWELLWGSPGTMLVAKAAGLDEAYERSAALLVEQWGDDGLWWQDMYGMRTQYLGPAHGFAGCVQALRGYVDDDELRRRIEPVLREHVVWDGDTVNWRPLPGKETNRTQWCHGAPGMVSTLGDLMPEDLLLAGAEHTWRHGPLEKGPGLCHGTGGNGYAFLRTYRVTGDVKWLERARSFAEAALAQRQHRYTLYTGDVGAALLARSVLDEDDRFPTLDVW